MSHIWSHALLTVLEKTCQFFNYYYIPHFSEQTTARVLLYATEENVTGMTYLIKISRRFTQYQVVRMLICKYDIFVRAGLEMFKKIKVVLRATSMAKLGCPG